MEDFEFTGKVFVKMEAYVSREEDKSFQLETMIDGHLTRLQAAGEVPEACLFDRRHSLRITGATEGMPPVYKVGCTCGYKTTMGDVNSNYKPFSK